jgi:hypothetical protein
MPNHIQRIIFYTGLRTKLQQVMEKLKNAVEIDSEEVWKDGMNELPGIYGVYVDFCLAGHDQYESFFNTLEGLLNKENNTPEGNSHILFILFDVVGIMDHAVAYGVYLINEFKRLIEEKEFDHLIENQDKFPIIMRKFSSQEESDAWIKQLREEEAAAETPKEDSEFDLSKMDTIGGIQ